MKKTSGATKIAGHSARAAGGVSAKELSRTVTTPSSAFQPMLTLIARAKGGGAALGKTAKSSNRRS